MDGIDYSLELDPDLIPQLVYEYLVHNCYSATAAAFASLWLSGSHQNMPAAISGGRAIIPTNKNSTMDMDTKTNISATKKSNAGMGIDDEGDMMMDDITHNDHIGSTMINPATRKLLLVAAQRSKLTTSQRHSPNNNNHNNNTSAVTSLDSRKSLYQLVLQGRISEAVVYCNNHFPDALNGLTPESEEVCFQLQCQQFIEFARNSASEALKYAQEEMIKYYAMGEKYSKPMGDVIALLAYTDPEKSPLSEYLSAKHREDVATALNSYVLAYDQLPPQTSLERLALQTTVVRAQLEDMSQETSTKKSSSTSGNSSKIQGQYPHWSLSGFLAGTEK